MNNSLKNKVTGGAIAALGLLSFGGLMHGAGEVIDAPYNDHPQATMLNVQLLNSASSKAKADACAKALSENQTCTAEATKLLLKRTENEGKVNQLFLYAPVTLLFTAFGLAVYKRKEEETTKAPTVTSANIAKPTV